MNKEPLKASFQLPDGREVVLETGKIAGQADGAVILRCGKTMLFASAVSATKPTEGLDFFPLFVDYQEKFAASGRIPGNFFRREARLSDYEVLVSRLVDRAIRPLFPDEYRNETQITINLISGDEETLPDAFAALAASAALWVSDIPWGGPISEVRVARIDGSFVVNPTRSALKNADMDIIVAATESDILMVEGKMNECSEEDLMEAMRVGHEAIKVQIKAQHELAQLVGEKALNKREVPEPESDPQLDEEIYNAVAEPILDIAHKALPKKPRRQGWQRIIDELVEQWKAERGEEWMASRESYIRAKFEKIKKELIRKMILEEGVRLDGRKYDEIRPIWTEIDYLPATHGSAVFTRGETQVLASLTLGTKQDQLLRDTALEMTYEDFILHYNFPGYSVGEVKPLRAPGRREIGHANLAKRALLPILPDDFPYTIRIVADVMSSNGSSSMATVCASSLALMDAGVPVKKNVSGIAMGLITEGDKVAILSDILGDEDALGDMDFKVTGTREGITACQMDIKIEGLSYELLAKALEQAKRGRLYILDHLDREISQPRPDLKEHAPRIEEFTIDKSFIGAVIGPGGKIIQEIQADTDTTISIEEKDDKGVVQIASSNKENIQKAKELILKIAFTPEVGDIYEGKVVSVMPYGVFVNFMGKSGLLHISEIAHHRIDNIEDYFKEGDSVRIKILDIDEKTGRYRLSAKALIPKEEDKKPAAVESRNAQRRTHPKDQASHRRGGQNSRHKPPHRPHRPPHHKRDEG